jgi:predicted Rossmann-fold nucleotide-binding protein
VRHTRGRTVEVVDPVDLDRRLARGVASLAGWHLISLDLTAYDDVLRRVDVAGALFLGCTFAEGTDAWLVHRGAIVFPAVPDIPVNPYRTELYTAEELYDRPEYAETLDARAYAWSQQPLDRDGLLGRSLHDHAVDEALGSWTSGHTLVGVMGGHALARGSEGYADAARLGRALASSYTVATGGGPGAMEAANLGAWLSPAPEAALDEALADLARVPSFRPDAGAWVQTAMEVRARFPDGADSLGIPTWHYGHEPPNAFATGIAKYFGNPVREAILLQVCDAGIVFLPGAGGTVQEVFQDACENYYADESSVAPMVLVGAAYWTEELPAWPLLRALARGRPMEPHVHLVDTVEEAVAVVSDPARR